MTTKEMMLEALRGMPDDVSVDQAVEKLYFLRQIDQGLRQADADDVMEHDEFLRELKAER